MKSESVEPALEQPDTPVGNDDYSLDRVPTTARYSWWSVAMQRFGQLSALAQFLLGATLGMGMGFWQAVLAITIGAVLLEIVSIFVGIAGMKEGLSTSVLARWTGFGRKGSALIGLVIAISLVGWFGIQNAVFAQGLHSVIGGLPIWAWSLIGGVAVTAIVVFGFHSMAWTAYLTVPAFILLAAWSIGRELSNHSLGELISSPPPGEPISLAAGATLVAGGFIVGAVMTPDMTRYNRSVGDVVKQTVVGVTLGEYVIGLIGVLLAHAIGTSDVVAIVISTSGLVGTLILVASILKINDWNLYSSSLGLVNVVHVLFKRRFSRANVTLVVGVVGSVLSAVGILNHFVGFLTFLGVLIPPIAGIMIAEYFVVRAWRDDLTRARAAGELPAHAPEWVPASLIAWAAAAVVGQFVHLGIPAINALAVAFVLYVVLGKLGLVRRKATPVGEGAA